MAFKLFENPIIIRQKTCDQITVSKRKLSLGVAFCEKYDIAKHTYMLLFYDRDKDRIALRPVNTDDYDAAKIHIVRAGNTHGHVTCAVQCTQFLCWCGLKGDDIGILETHFDKTLDLIVSESLEKIRGKKNV
jgi:hypothetical protein